MKKIIAALCAGLCLTALPVQAEEPRIPDLIKNGTISSKQVQKGNSLEYKFEIQNIGIKCVLFGSAKTLRMVWVSENGQSIEEDIPYHGTGSYQGTISITDGMTPGTWKLSELKFLSETYHGKLPFRAEELVLTEAEGEHVNYQFATFTVQGTTADKKAPTVKVKTIGVTKKVLKKNGKAKFYLKANDTSSLRYVVCTWRDTKTKQDVYGNMKYSKKRARYEYQISGTDFEKGTKLKLKKIEACDKYGNVTKVTKKCPKIIIEKK